MKKLTSLLACFTCGAACFAVGAGISAKLDNAHNQNVIVQAYDEDLPVIYVGDAINVETKILSHNGEDRLVEGQIITPSGASYVGSRFTAEEAGVYQIVYKTYFIDGNSVVEKSETVEYLCKMSSSDFFTCNDQVTASYGQYRYSTDRVQHEGVVFDVKSGAEIVFNTVLNPNDFDLDTPIIDFIVDPSTQGVNDFAGLTVRVTDVEDPSNYIEFLCVDGQSHGADGATYVRANFQGGIAGGWQAAFGTVAEHYITTGTGTGLAHSFHASPKTEPTHNLKLYLDYATKSTYGAAHLGTFDQQVLINDFTNKLLYKFNPWGGFTSDKVRVSVKPTNFSNPNGRIVIKSVGGIELNSDIMTDEVAPIVTVDYDGQDPKNLPKAEMGTTYKLFDATVTDNYDADLKADVSVSYRDMVNGQYIDVFVKDNEFRVDKAGVYVVTYSATDRSGNAAQKVRLQILTGEIEPLTITQPTDSLSVGIYSKTYLPTVDDLTIIGGSGIANVTRTVYAPNGEEIVAPENEPFIPDTFGDYTVKFTATDYLGNYAESVYTLTSSPLSAPTFIDDITLPPVMIKGFTYTLPLPKTVETVNGEVLQLSPVIKVNGEISNGTVVADGNEMTVEYSVTGESGTTALPLYAIPVVDVKRDVVDEQGAPTGKTSLNPSAYFYAMEQGISVIENRRDITLTADGDAGEILFVNAVNTSSFSLMLTRDPLNMNFDGLSVTLTDAMDKNVSVTFVIDVVNGKISFPGESDLPFPVVNNELRLQYTNASRLVSDIQNGEVAMCLTDDNGKPFNGFSGSAYMSIRFIGAKTDAENGDSRILLTALNNQSLGHGKKLDEGENLFTKAVSDSADPVISFNADIITEQFMSDTFVYPTFEAYDVLSEVAKATISVRKPDGTTLEGDNHCQETFTIDQYGDYRIVFYAEDTNGNSVRLQRTVQVNDNVAPTLAVNELSKTVYSVGETVNIPTYTASDNMNQLFVDVIVYLPNNLPRLASHEENGQITYYLNNDQLYPATFRVSDTSFRTEEKGEYRIRYVAYDSQYNTTVVEYVVTVR